MLQGRPPFPLLKLGEMQRARRCKCWVKLGTARILGLLGLALGLLLFTCKASYFAPSIKTQPVLRPAGQSLPAEEGWYRNQVFYHIWVKSFADSDGDGIGDFNGIRSKLGYLQDLGVQALWLSPIFAAKTQHQPYGNMHGYDVTDHYSINPYFGSEEDLAQLLQEAHKRDLRIIFDFVPNHVSNAHPWFRAFLAGDPEYRDFFISRTGSGGAAPSGWRTFAGNPWHAYRKANGEKAYYYGIFSPEMPDLNYRNPKVRSAMADVLRYWLNFGFDGVRIDAAKYIFEDSETRAYENLPETLDFYHQLGSELLAPYSAKGYAKFSVLEVWDQRGRILQYLDGTEISSAFDFDFPNAVVKAIQQGKPVYVRQILAAYQKFPTGTLLADFLSNHDNVASRPMSSFSGNAEQAELAAAILLFGSALPFVYYGNEIGMEGRSGQDIRLRRRFDWQKADFQAKQPSSILQSYRRILSLRKEQPALHQGLAQPENWRGPFLAFRRSDESSGQELLFAANLSSEAAPLSTEAPENMEFLASSLSLSPEAGAALARRKADFAPYQWALFRLLDERN